MSARDVIIIGSGASGLACAAALRRAHIGSVILEKEAQIAASWRNRPDGLRLTAGRLASAMPRSRFRHGVATFPTRDEMIEHLECFADKHRLRIRTGVTVERIDRDGIRWVVRTSAGVQTARHVVVTTGLFAEPVIPQWPGQELLGDHLTHASAYRNPQPYAGKAVLVVGAGTTGIEIAEELSSHDASSVLLSVRTPPNLVPRALGLVPGRRLFAKLPTTVLDTHMQWMRRMVIGDLTAYGFPVPSQGPFSMMITRHNTPTNIGKAAIRAIRAGRIRVVAAVDHVSQTGVHLADGSVVAIDAVIAATGYRPGLEPLVGHLNVLNHRGEPRPYAATGPNAGLHFAGFDIVPGQLAFSGQAARRVVKEISASARVPRLVAH